MHLKLTYFIFAYLQVIELGLYLGYAYWLTFVGGILLLQACREKKLTLKENDLRETSVRTI